MPEAAYDLDRNLLDFQREASAAARPETRIPKPTRPEIPELEKRRLVAEGWSTESIESYRKFSHESALLYPLTTRGGRNFGAVSTPAGQGSLVSVLGDTCRVLLVRRRRVSGQSGSRQYQPTENFSTGDVKPYRKEA